MCVNTDRYFIRKKAVGLGLSSKRIVENNYINIENNEKPMTLKVLF